LIKEGHVPAKYTSAVTSLSCPWPGPHEQFFIIGWAWLKGIVDGFDVDEGLFFPICSNLVQRVCIMVNTDVISNTAN
jgi:hypothetical protein